MFLALVAVVVSTMALSLPVAVLAQDPAATPADGALATPLPEGETAVTTEEQPAAVAMNGMNVRASEITGYAVRNSAGEDLGTISDVMIMAADGRIPFLAVAFGGFLGIGENVVPVPQQAVALNTLDKVAIIDIPKETLESAPTIDPANWPSLAVEGWDKQYADYWSSAGINLQAQAGQPATLTEDVVPGQGQPQAAPPAAAEPGQAGAQPLTVAVGAVRQSELRDFDVYNQNNEKLADIEDLIFNWQNGAVSYMLINYFPPADAAPADAPAMSEPAADAPAADAPVVEAPAADAPVVADTAITSGPRLIPVPWGHLTLDPLNKKFLLDTSKIDLTNAPGFDPANVPNMTDADWDLGFRDFWANLTS
jgi:sporulation protein YlmC with PRC-barrel domain